MKVTQDNLIELLKSKPTAINDHVEDAEYDEAYNSMVSFMESEVMKRYRWLWKNDDLDKFFEDAENLEDENIFAVCASMISEEGWRDFFARNCVDVGTSIRRILVDGDARRIYEDISASEHARGFYRILTDAAQTLSTINMIYFKNRFSGDQYVIAVSVGEMNRVKPSNQAFDVDRMLKYGSIEMGLSIKTLGEIYNPENLKRYEYIETGTEEVFDLF